MISTGPQTAIPTFVYDDKKLPAAFAFFTSKPKADKFIKHAHPRAAISRELGADMKVMQYQGWAFQTINNFLRGSGKEVPPEQLAHIVFYGMPVFVDPHGPNIANCTDKVRAYDSFKEFAQSHFAQIQLFELLDDCELGKSEYRDDHTIIRAHTKDEKTREHLCFATSGALAGVEDLRHEIEIADVTKRVFYVTGFYPNEAMAYDDAANWVTAQMSGSTEDASSDQAS